MTPTLSVVVPFYRNQRMLSRQYLVWALEWPAALKECVEVIIVDDGSPEPAANVARLYHADLPALSIYRVLEDRPWNQHSARNIGAHEARGEWLLLTDVDHVIPVDTLKAALEFGDPACGYTFARRDAPSGEPWKSDHWSTMAHTLNREGARKPHVNSMALTREAYWRVGGYDESYSGVYGTDSMFRRRLWSKLQQVECPLPLIRVDRAVIPDASTTTLQRQDGREPGIRERIAREKRARGEDDVVKVLQSPYERVL